MWACLFLKLRIKILKSGKQNIFLRPLKDRLHKRSHSPVCSALTSKTTGYVFAAIKLPRLGKKTTKKTKDICAYSIYMILINSNELKNQGVLPKEKYATKYSWGPFMFLRIRTCAYHRLWNYIYVKLFYFSGKSLKLSINNCSINNYLATICLDLFL